jgi:cytidylate kinase
MASILIVSGCPGSGKTTLARSLAGSASQGLHLVSDLFYQFLVNRVDPTLPASHYQNTVIMRALARAARTFAEGEYSVVVDGVIGPWFLPVFREELAGGPAVSYLVLLAPESEALRRVRLRQGPGLSPSVHRMAAAFADLGALASHTIDTASRSADEVLHVAQARLSAGQFVLHW